MQCAVTDSLYFLFTSGSTTQAPTNPPTRATNPPTEPTSSTRQSTSATSAPTSAPTGPRPYSGITTSLPSEPSRLSQPPLRDLQNNLDSFRRVGYVPESINPFKVYSEQYFSIVYTYVGTTASQNDFLVRYNLRENAARDFIDNTSGFKVQIIAPYIRGTTFYYLVVMNRTNEATAYFINETPRSFESKYEGAGGLRSQGYSIISRKLLQTSNLFISGVAKGRPQSNYYFNNFDLTGVYNVISSEYRRGFFLADLHSYWDHATQSVRYAGVFSPERFGSAQYIIMTDLGQESLFNQVESYRKLNYHLKTVLPLPVSNYPYFIAAWWK